MNAALQSQAILEGRTAKPAPLTRHKQHLLELYKNGELLQKANELTLLSGNGTLHRTNGEKFLLRKPGFTERVLYGSKDGGRCVQRFFR